MVPCVRSDLARIEWRDRVVASKNTGIYAIEHRASGKMYVGSVCAKTIVRRWGQHRRALFANRHSCVHLQNAWNLYGPEAFFFCVLKVIIDPVACLQAEQVYFDKEVIARKDGRGCLYNTNLVASGGCGPHDDETKQKMRESAHRGDEHWSRLYPERVLRGEQNGASIHRDKMARGDAHGSKTHPERVARGSRHSSRTHPESVPRGDQHHSRVHPENVARGENHWSVRNPEKVQRGDAHYSKTSPEKVARGEQSGARRHPEKVPRGEGHGRAKLTEETVRDILRRGATGESGASISRALGLVKPEAVNSILRGKTWGHIVIESFLKPMVKPDAPL